MANPDHVEVLKQGVEVWNKWRKNNRIVIPDLSGVNLINSNLTGALLSFANLRGANLVSSKFSRAKLHGAKLHGAKLTKTIFYDADLTLADLPGASLDGAKLRNAVLYSANLKQANLRDAYLRGAKLIDANLNEADLTLANLTDAFLSNADLYRANLTDADLRESNLNNVNLRDANLTNADLRGANVVQINLAGATTTGTRLYGSSRDDWIIDGVVCSYVYWDRSGKEKTPKDRDFETGEFEELYKQLPTVEYIFAGALTPFDLIVMGKVVDEINIQNPEFKLVFDSLQSRGENRAVFTIQDKGYAETVKDSITRKFENHIAALEGQKQALMEVISEFATRKGRVKLIAGGDITMGDQIKTTGQTGDAFIAKDQATFNIQKITNPAAKDLVEQIGKLIQSDDAPDDDKGDAQQQLSNMAKELEKPQPEKGRLKRFYDRMIDVVPKIAEKLPWDKIVGSILT